MSGIAALWWFDGCDPQPQLRRMLALMAHRGPDGCGLWAEGAVGLAHAHLATTPEARGEQQPVQGQTRRHVLVMDGRVDNRAELLAQLSLGNTDARSTDAELVLAAYGRWGVDLGAHVIGDFALVLWDGALRRLLCLRDTAGVRPLYYFHRANVGFAAGSELAQVLSLPVVSRAPNEGMIGEYLACQSVSMGETLYRDVHRLAPGHALLLCQDRCRTHRYWRPEEIEQLQLRDEREYADRYRHVLRQAVLARSRSITPIAADLSGGLDSSSVCGVLAALRREGLVGQPVQAFTLTFPGQDCDETEYARAVAERAQLPWQRVKALPLTPVDYDLRARTHLDLPGYPNGTMALPAQAQACAAGMRVTLSGLGGDDLISGSPDWERSLAHWQAGEHRRALSELAVCTPRYLLRCVGRNVLPRPWVTAIQQHQRTRKLPPWIRPAFARRIHLTSRLYPSLALLPGWSAARALRLGYARDGWTVHALEVENRHLARVGLEARYPFLDRRLVELSLSLPESQCRVGHVHKVVLRNAMHGLLPKVVHERRSKANFTQVFRLAWGAQPPFFPLSLADTGWVDPHAARQALDKALQLGSLLSWPMWMLYALHLWFPLRKEIP